MDGDPVYKGKQILRSDMEARYFFDAYNQLGYGYGTLLDGDTGLPVPQPELPEIR